MVQKTWCFKTKYGKNNLIYFLQWYHLHNTFGPVKINLCIGEQWDLKISFPPIPNISDTATALLTLCKLFCYLCKAVYWLYIYTQSGHRGFTYGSRKLCNEWKFQAPDSMELLFSRKVPLSVCKAALLGLCRQSQQMPLYSLHKTLHKVSSAVAALTICSFIVSYE